MSERELRQIIANSKQQSLVAALNKVNIMKEPLFRSLLAGEMTNIEASQLEVYTKVCEMLNDLINEIEEE